MVEANRKSYPEENIREWDEAIEDTTAESLRVMSLVYNSFFPGYLLRNSTFLT